MRIKGAFPVRWAPQDGQPGTGVTIQQTITRYAKSTSGTEHPASGWQTTVPTVADGLYLWTWVYVRYSDGTETNAYSVARMGIDGKGIQSSTVTYSQQATSVDPATITNWGAFPSTLTDGYWLYTKTHIVYSDGATTDSYSVSQVGVGSYYAGTQEYWAIGESDTTPPEGAATPGTYVNGQTIQTSWSQQRVAGTAALPYVWNFEISADSRGNRYVTQAVCIGNFAKGIKSIVEAYAISAYGTPDEGSSYPSDIAAADWTDEQHAAAPTQTKRYQWNRTITTYNDNSTETRYHVSAVCGLDGKGATYLDLDNENDSILYDGAGNLVSGSVSTNIYLYSNGQRITSGLPAFTIKEKSSFLTASIPNGSNVLTVTKFEGTTYSGYVIVQCTYNNVLYTARFTVKKLVGVDKYELELDHTAVGFNETKETLSTASVKVKVWRTAQNGTRTQLAVSTATALTKFGLQVWMYPDGVSGAAAGQVDFTNGVGTVSLTANFAKQHTNFAVALLKLVSENTYGEIDRETVPIDKVADGDIGPGGVILDLDNENDSMLYDGTGSTLISGSVTSQAKLLVGGEDKTSDVTEWDCVDKNNCTASIDTNGLITVSAMSAVSGSCKARAKYGNQYYYAKLTLKKLIGVDKYEIVCTPNALTYNTTKGTNPQQNVNIKVYRTAQNGTRSLVAKLSDYSLKLRYYWQQTAGTDIGPTNITDGTGSGQYNSGATRSLYANTYVAYRYELLDANNQLLDAETVPISKTSDGGTGSNSIMLDLDNENDSFLYDGADNVVSNVVESYASLYDGPNKVSSGITWSIVSADCSGVDVKNGGDATSTSTTYARSTNPTAAWITTAGLLRVNGLSASQGQVKVMATYNSKQYTKILTLKKLRGVDKYDLVISPAALTYNSSTSLVNGASSVTVTVEIWRTAQNGTRTKISDYNGDNVYGLSLELSASAGSTLTETKQTYGCTFAVSSTVANANSSISIVLKKGTLTHDSETIPIAKTSNGSGSAGPAAKSIYKCSFDQPATPTGSSPQGTGNLSWKDDAYKQPEIAIQQQGDWYKGDDGYWTAPAIGPSSSAIQTLMFVTTAANQKIYLRAKCHTSSYAYLRIGNIDSVSPTTDYMRSISGSNQDTGDIEVNVATAGAHFICIAYVRGYTASDTYAKFACGQMSIWRSDAKTYTAAGAVSTWSTPYKVTSDEIDEAVQTRANLLLQTAFLASRMDQWTTKNGDTTEGMDGRNGFAGTPDLTTDITELLKQIVHSASDKRLLANTWYTLSFWAKAAPYTQINKNITSYNYGFGTESVYLQGGVECELTINGYCSSAARSAGKELRVFVYDSGWNWSTSVAITSTSSTSASVKFTPPSSGLYYITSYAYSSGATSSQTVTINWYRINRGMRLVTYLYPSTSSQSSYCAIDVNAGRIKDGQNIGSTSPSDNNAEWQLTEVWTRHTLTFKTRSSIPTTYANNILFRMAQASNKTWICMPKLEQGTVATAYCTNDGDVADMAADELGFPNDRGVYVSAPSDPYVWNDTRRDYVAYEVSGEWKRYFVKQKGMSVPSNTPPTAGGNTYWEEGSRISTLLVNTIVGANASLTFATSNRLLIKNSAGSVSLGMSGVTSDYDYPLWVGATYENRANAPFKVNLVGHMYATRGYIGSWVIRDDKLMSQKGLVGSTESEDYDNANFVPYIALDSVAGEIRASSTMRITRDGLFLYNGSRICAKIVNQTISNEIDTSPATIGLTTINTSYSGSVYFPTSGSFSSTGYWTVRLDLGYFYNGSTIRVKNGRFIFTPPTAPNRTIHWIQPYVFEIYLSNGTHTISVQSKTLTAGNSVDQTLTFDSTYNIDGSTHPEGHYYLYYQIKAAFSAENNTAGQSGSSNSATLYIRDAQYAYSKSVEQLCLIGNNGLFNRQGTDTYMLNTAYGFVVRKGNYILEVTNSGVRVSRNGGTSWTQLGS